MAAAAAALMIVLVATAYALRRNFLATLRLQRLFLVAVSLVYCWHIAVSLWAGSFQPGVITSALFLPVYIWLVRRLPRDAA
jgi:hypothetical protein